MHSAHAAIDDRNDGRYYYAHCTFCGWEGTASKSHKEAAEQAVGHSDTGVLMASYQDMKLQFPDASWEQVFGLEEIPDEVDS